MAKRFSYRIFLLTLAQATLILGIWGMAWACTVQPRILTLTPTSGTVGTHVIVSGDGTIPETEIVVHWNGLGGPRLGVTESAADGTFAVSIVVPAVENGVYSVVIATQDAGIGRNSFEVIGSSQLTENRQAPASLIRSLPDSPWAGLEKTADLPADYAPQGVPVIEGRESAQRGALGLAMSAVGVAILMGTAVLYSKKTGSLE